MAVEKSNVVNALPALSTHAGRCERGTRFDRRDPIEIYSDGEQCIYRRVGQLFFSPLRSGYRCARTPPGQFKGPDPAEWPRSILGADRMPTQDHLLPLDQAHRKSSTTPCDLSPRQPLPSYPTAPKREAKGRGVQITPVG